MDSLYTTCTSRRKPNWMLLLEHTGRTVFLVLAPKTVIYTITAHRAWEAYRISSAWMIRYASHPIVKANHFPTSRLSWLSENHHVITETSTPTVFHPEKRKQRQEMIHLSPTVTVTLQRKALATRPCISAVTAEIWMTVHVGKDWKCSLLWGPIIGETLIKLLNILWGKNKL